MVGAGYACGIDISPKMIEKAKALHLGVENLDFRVADSGSIPFDDASFDRVLCTFSFHHYADPTKALAEIRRVMKPGARFVLIDSARDISLAIWLQDRGRRYLERSHVRYYSVSEMKSLLDKAQMPLLEEISTVKRFADHGKVFTGLMIARCMKSGSQGAIEAD